MADAIAIAVKNGIFGARSVEKAKQGHDGRIPIATAQASNVFNEVLKLDGRVGKSSQTAIDALKNVSTGLETAAKSEKLLEYAGKGINFLSRHINPLICVSAGIDVLNSDNKEEALVTNTMALISMFGGEHLMKKHLDDAIDYAGKNIIKVKNKNKLIDNVVNAIEKSNSNGKIKSIAHGVAFVVGSCVAYGIGQKFGNLLLGKKEESKK